MKNKILNELENVDFANVLYMIKEYNMNEDDLKELLKEIMDQVIDDAENQ
jgi:hypothetical protein